MNATNHSVRGLIEVLPLLYLIEPAHPESNSHGFGLARGPFSRELLPPYLQRGSLIVIRPTPHSEWSDLDEAIEQAGRRFVNGAMVLWPDCVGRRRAVELAARAGPKGVQAIIWQSDPPTPALRRALTELSDWPALVLRWLRWRGILPSAQVREILEFLAGPGSCQRNIAHVAAAYGSSRRSWYDIFKRANLSPPNKWHTAFRAVRMAMVLQRDPKVPLHRVAFEHGFSSGAVLSDRLYDVIGARPSMIRCRLGGLWVLADALRRQGIL